MFKVFAITFAVTLSTIGLGQSASGVAQVQTFHVQGTIDSMTNGAAPVEVNFVGGSTDRTVVVDDKGFYQIDLPVGTYTMTASSPPFGPKRISVLTKYVRFFRVISPTAITLNGSLYRTYSCDGVWAGQDAEEMFKDSCGGGDSFLFPSNEGVPLSLDIQYVCRVRTGKLISYSSIELNRRPVQAAYNLFALQADSVDYDREDGTIRAYGNVTFEDPSGQIHVGSAAFKFRNGEAIRLW